MTEPDPFAALRILMESAAPRAGIAAEIARLVESGVRQVDIAEAVQRSESWVSKHLVFHQEGIARPFVRLALSFNEFETLRGAVDASARSVAQKIAGALMGAEKRFYTGELQKLEALQARLARIAPRGEDAE